MEALTVARAALLLMPPVCVGLAPCSPRGARRQEAVPAGMLDPGQDGLVPLGLLRENVERVEEPRAGTPLPLVGLLRPADVGVLKSGGSPPATHLRCVSPSPPRTSPSDTRPPSVVVLCRRRSGRLG